MVGADDAEAGRGRYRIVERLGAGGMGVVYRAIATDDGREIALKLLAPEHVQDEERRRRFVREARLASSLDHPGIVRVHEVGDVDGNVFLAMELVRGETLRHWIDGVKKSGEAPNVADALTIARAIASAVVAAHDKGIVHRDLKPDNVMIEDGLRVRVLDFGLAKLREVEGGALYDAVTETNLTNDSRVMGTPGYMAPEQATGKEVGLRADVFALGAILYEMLTGSRAFVGDSAMDIIVSLTRDEPPPPSTKNPAVGQALDALVAHCLAKDAARRPSMTELEIALGRPALLARAPAPSHRRLRAALGGGAVLLAGALAVTLASRAGAPRGSASASSAATASARAEPLVPAVVPTAVTELPLPSSSVPEALEAYKKAVADERDGAEDASLIGLERAAKLDPDMAAAHLRLAMKQGLIEAQSGRAHFTEAMKQRGRLSPRDRDLLDAAQPLFQRDPADMDEWRRRLEAAATRYPGDAELWNEVAAMRDVLGDWAGAAEAATKATTLDQHFGLAYSSRAGDEAYLGKFETALATVARCLEDRPNASWCMWVREFIDGAEGRCAAVEASARARIAADPLLPDSYKALVFALGSLGKSRELIREAIDQTIARMTDPFGKQRLFLNLNTRLDLLFGDFTSAIKHTDELRRHVASRSDVSDHAAATVLSSDIYREIGRPERAAQLGKEFLDRKEAWQVAPVVHDYMLADDLTPTIASYVFHAHAMSKTDYDATLGAWRDRWNKGLRGDYRPFLWVYGYAPVVENAADAAEVLPALTHYSPIPPYIPNGALPEASIGRALWLGGREDEGIAHLTRAARSCETIVRPVMWIHAHAWLAEALEKRGDVAGACKELDVVLSYWGHAKPRSVTAESALAKSRALGCAH